MPPALRRNVTLGFSIILCLIVNEHVALIGGYTANTQSLEQHNATNQLGHNHNHNRNRNRNHNTNTNTNTNRIVENNEETVLATTTLDTHRLAKRMDLELCLGQFDVHKNTIIRTGESQAIGGKYLQGLELDTMEECQRLCCETESCDVYVFENKNDGYCYLFECGPPENFHCKFTRHANYTSAVLTPVVRHPTLASVTTPRPALPHLATTNISQQEWELSNLKMKPEVRDKTLEMGTANANGGATASAAASNGGASMNGASDVGLPQAPQTENGFTQKASNVSERCGRFQFKCHSGECIAVYNACDGIPQCEDGSDEGPECSGAATGIAGNSINTKSNQDPVTAGNSAPPLPQYQSTMILHQTPQQQQQLHNMQQPQQQPRPQQTQVAISPPLINNREDANAWANRKMIANTQQRESVPDAEPNGHTLTHKGSLQLAAPNAALPNYLDPSGNRNPPIYTSTLEQSGLYARLQPEVVQSNAFMPLGQAQGQMQVVAPQPQSQLQPQPAPPPPPPPPAPPSAPLAPTTLVNNNWQQQQQVVQQHLPAAASAVEPTSLQQQQQPQQLPQGPVYILNGQQQQQQGQTVIRTQVAPQPVAAAAPQTNVQLQHHNSASSHTQSVQKAAETAPATDADSEYEDYEENATEPPKKKQRKHKKTKAKSADSNRAVSPEHKDPIELSLEQQKSSQHTAPSAAVHEQYKIIHENLALEFRDHDGRSERPGGAVLSLTLGLLVTAALAILIGCRMRTVGRRGRRLGGKTPYAHEADFLVNGMYL